MASHSAVTIDDNFAAGQTSVALWAANHEVAGGIDEKLRFVAQHLFRQNSSNHFLNDETANLRMFHVARVLR